MSVEEVGEPPMYYMYYDCTGDGTGRTFCRVGNDVSPANNVLPDGCDEITKEQYDAAIAVQFREQQAAHAATVADAAQAEDDRITDLVAVKVAEILAAQGDS